MHKFFFAIAALIACALSCAAPSNIDFAVPLAEHPRPDFMRGDWMNLNGAWEFAPDSTEAGEKSGWEKGKAKFPMKIVVPFSWAAPMSGYGRKDVNVAWYARTVVIPRDWRGKHVYLVVGACDFAATLWCNGQKLGEHEGGYTPFEFDLTPALSRSGNNRIVIRVEDKPTKGRLAGKQVYGEAKGIWQTVYLEPRGSLFLRNVRFIPDIASGRVRVEAALSGKAPEGCSVALELTGGSSTADRKTDPGVTSRSRRGNGAKPVVAQVAAGTDSVSFTVTVPDPRLWTLDDPYLYDAEVSLTESAVERDRVRSYFGMRSIGTALLPGSNDRYVTLNGKPVYLKMTLDQSYHPEGFYTFPGDRFMKEEIERAKRIGLNTLRIHIKTEMPRKLYWADALGVLLMCDIPNIGGEPDEYGRANWEAAAWSQIERDFNHPAIFSWVLFNESWGLTTGPDYTKETQEWVRSLYARAKKLDPTRLVEDNSPDQGRRWHVESDLNSWHAYLPGYKWASYMDDVVKNTFPGSKWNYIEPYVQADVPMFNSECGNVWGYNGGTGDVDIAYEYHIMMNEYRRRPKICGFLFTEFHDVINEWNGYYRFDRTEKEWGLSDLCPGMTVGDFHRDLYLIPGADFKMTVKPGAKFMVPVTASLLGDIPAGDMTVLTLFHGWNRFGEHATYSTGKFAFPAKPYATMPLPPVTLEAPAGECLAMVCTYLVGAKGDTLSANFTPVRVLKGDSPRRETVPGVGEVLRCAPGAYAASEWSKKKKDILGGLKTWGTGKGFVEYAFPWPEGLDTAKADSVVFIAELGSRRVQGKDMADSYVVQDIAQVGAKGVDPGHNPNSYPMTDTTRHPSDVTITLNSTDAATVHLDNDAADHRGVLSWLAQKEDGNLSEAGSFGQLVRVAFGPDAVKAAAAAKKIVVRLEVKTADDRSGGLSVYGEKFGRYPLDPTVVVKGK